MAKTIDKTYYDVVSMGGCFGLQIRDKDSFESVVKEINDITLRAKKSGYDNDEKWLIVLVHMTRYWDDNGIFIFEEVKKTAYALYDNGHVKKISLTINLPEEEKTGE